MAQWWEWPCGHANGIAWCKYIYNKEDRMAYLHHSPYSSCDCTSFAYCCPVPCACYASSASRMNVKSWKKRANVNTNANVTCYASDGCCVSPMNTCHANGAYVHGRTSNCSCGCGCDSFYSGTVIDALVCWPDSCVSGPGPCLGLSCSSLISGACHECSLQSDPCTHLNLSDQMGGQLASSVVGPALQWVIPSPHISYYAVIDSVWCSECFTMVCVVA